MTSRTPPLIIASSPRATWMRDDREDLEDSFHISDSVPRETLNGIFDNSRYASVSASHRPSISESRSTDLRNLTGGTDSDVEEELNKSVRTHISTTSNRGCCGCGCIKRFRAAQRHRKCPHTLRICLIFFMFFLLGIFERGWFVVLFQLLDHHFTLESGQAVTVYFAIRFAIYVSYPLMGCLADVFFGHYKVIRSCLCVAWLGAAFLALSFAIYEYTTSDCKTTEECVWMPSGLLLGIGCVILGAGLTGIRVNLIPFGADQLPDVSGGELSSYFYWHYFFISLGHCSTVGVMFLMFHITYYSIVFLTITTALTLFLCIFITFPWISVPKNGNPLKLVAGVLSAAFAPKKPIKTTAFDVGRPQPSRLDRAMIKYGGPYMFDEVENVKTFFRILMIVMSCVGYYTVFSQLQSTTTIQSYKMRLVWSNSCPDDQLAYIQWKAQINVNLTCKQAEALPSSLFGAANLLPLLLVIPLFDRLVYTCLNGWKWFSMLARMAVGNFFIIASLLSAAVIEYERIMQLAEGIRRGSVTINTISYHEDMSLYNVASPMTQLYIAIPYFFFVFAELLCNITAVEFIYAQSPDNMKGLLIGMLFASEGLAMGLSAVLTAIVSFGAPGSSFFSFFANTQDFFVGVLDSTSNCTAAIKNHPSIGCNDGILFVYILLLIIAVLSAIFFAVAALRYKYRRRDQDPYMLIWLIPDDRQSKIMYLIRKCCC